jgi:oligopeptide/dipeptide ABC transporter ATP-binding protein
VAADEINSMLDASTRIDVLNLLADLKTEFHLSYIMIAHDLSVVNHVSNRIAVMYLGKIIELSTNRALLAKPLHPYTQALISAIPVLDPDKKKERIILKGELPSPTNPPAGCPFHPRCWMAMGICKTDIPKWVEIEPGHYTMCHLYE